MRTHAHTSICTVLSYCRVSRKSYKIVSVPSHSVQVENRCPRPRVTCALLSACRVIRCDNKTIVVRGVVTHPSVVFHSATATGMRRRNYQNDNGSMLQFVNSRLSWRTFKKKNSFFLSNSQCRGARGPAIEIRIIGILRLWTEHNGKLTSNFFHAFKRFFKSGVGEHFLLESGRLIW